ncbi:MFS family permease [Methanolobus bombayensis]|nr:MFS family permease [Methanolobus bombayensis]
MGLSNSIIPVLPEIASASLVESGTIAYTLLFSGYFIGALLTLIPFGLLADRFDHMKLIVFAVALTTLSGIMLILTENTFIMILARLLEGAACGAFFPPAYAILAEFNKRKQYLGEFNFLLNAGLATGTITAGFLAGGLLKGAIVLFTALAVLIFSTAIIMNWIHRTNLYSNIDKDENKIMKNNFSKTGRTKSTLSIKNEAKKVLKIALDPDYFKTWFITFFIFGITGVMLVYYPQYSSNMLSKPELGIVIAIVYISSMATNLIAGRSKVGYGKMISSGIILASLGILTSIWFPFTGFTLLGIGSGMGMIGLPVAVSFMNTDKGLRMGIFTTYTYMGLAFLPMIAGYLINYGYQTMFIVTSIFMILTLLLRGNVQKNVR